MPEIEIHLPKWKPKQQLLWDSPATEILIAGDTRSGKSFFVRKAYIKYCSQIPGLITDILRLNYDDVIKNYMVGETSFPVLLEPWEKAGLVKITEAEITFWNGSTITLGHCSDDRALRKHQGNPTHLRTIDEAGQFSEDNLRGLGGWLAITEAFRAKLPEQWRRSFPKLWFLTNFIGPGMTYFRRSFLEVREPYAISRVGQHMRQYVPMQLSDNDSEDPELVKARIKEAFADPRIQSALLECNWQAMAGQFFTMWNPDRHVIADFTPPKWWYRYRSMDIGWAEPTAVYWIAVSDGEPFRDEQGRERWFPRGARIFYNEWYVCDAERPARGLEMSNIELADGIIERSEHEARKVPTLTDSKPFQGTGGRTPAQEFQKRGVNLTQVNTGPGSRVTGWSVMKSAMIGIDVPGIEDKIPMVYFCECCKYARQYIPAIPSHPSEKKQDDAAEHGEATHSPDAIRYGLIGHEIIWESVLPLQSKIDREMKARRPTMNKILKGAGHVGLN